MTALAATMSDKDLDQVSASRGPFAHSGTTITVTEDSKTEIDRLNGIISSQQARIDEMTAASLQFKKDVMAWKERANDEIARLNSLLPPSPSLLQLRASQEENLHLRDMLFQSESTEHDLENMVDSLTAQRDASDEVLKRLLPDEWLNLYTNAEQK